MKLARFLIISIIYVLLSPISLVLADKKASSLDHLVEMQKRNFDKTVEFCKSKEPLIGMSYVKYLDDFYAGTRSGLKKIGQDENEKMFATEKAKNEFMGMADIQGNILYQRISSNPALGCKRLKELLSKSSVAAVEKQIISMYRDYLKKRQEYCKKIPKPENCG